MRPAASRQRGVALLALLAAVALAASWFVVKQLNTESGAIAAARTNRNAEVLNRAKQALIGYIAAQAAKSGEDRPGALPCPEAPGNFNNAANEGSVSYPCTPPLVGRFPWRSLGLDKLVDTYGEPLWYAVASGWAGASTVINSNCASTTAIAGMPCSGPAGRLTIDGVTGDVVAVIIAPGPAITAAASAGCAAWSQMRPTAAPPDWRNYLECQNATSPADNTFATTGPSGSFNDQVITITTSEILPAIEAAIASRIEREIAPLLRAMYSGGSWSGSSSTPWLPFPVNFANPSASATWQDATATLQGLLPLSYAETSPGSGILCTAGSAPRCNPTFVAWTGTPTLSTTSTNTPGCTVTPTQLDCSFTRVCFLFCFAGGTQSFTLTASAANAGRAMRQFNILVPMTNVNANPRAVSGALTGSGAATIVLTAETNTTTGGGLSGIVGNLLCGLPLPFLSVCRQETFSVPITLLADHPLLDPGTVGSGAVGWFLRNNWHEVAYYAVDDDFAPGGSRTCTSGATCLSVSHHRDATGAVDAGKQRAVLLLSGRSLSGAARPNGTLADWLEGANADGASPFEVRSTTLINNRSFNDRVAVLDANP